MWCRRKAALGFTGPASLRAKLGLKVVDGDNRTRRAVITHVDVPQAWTSPCRAGKSAGQFDGGTGRYSGKGTTAIASIRLMCRSSWRQMMRPIVADPEVKQFGESGHVE